MKTWRQHKPRLNQGDIIRDVEWIETIREKSWVVEIHSIFFPLVIVLTQDCDLSEDYRHTRAKKTIAQGVTPVTDKKLISVLVAPLYNEQHLFEGQHLSDLGIQMRAIKKGKTEGSYLITNQNPRYHRLDFSESDPVVPCVIDFKHYFSISAERLRRAKRDGFVLTVAPMYREAISHRFASFLARIGLPEPEL